MQKQETPKDCFLKIFPFLISKDTERKQKGARGVLSASTIKNHLDTFVKATEEQGSRF